MTAGTRLECAVAARRQHLFGDPKWNGIDFVDVSDDQQSLCIHFFNGVPKGITLSNILISGGRRITDVRAEAVSLDPAHDVDLDDCLRVKLNKVGDFSTYRLCLVGGNGHPFPNIDPHFSCIDFRFRLDCAGDVDCLERTDCETNPAEPIEIDYLAKDYASFQRLIYDRLALIMPDWKERHAPDLGVTLVELLAYAGDYLSYYQDAVGTEAYLDTARRRISVRRHLRLIDYHLHEGCNARAFVSVEFDKGEFSLNACEIFFSTDPAGARQRDGTILSEAMFARLDRQYCDLFEPVLPAEREIVFRAGHSEIFIHDWGDEECCLAKGATHAALIDAGDPPGSAASGTTLSAASRRPKRKLALRAGDYLAFEEVIGPSTGNPADADPTHRHIVRLTSVEKAVDALLGIPILKIGWAEDDALPFPLCLSVRRGAPRCDLIRNVSVARGNIVPVDHGWNREELLGTPGSREVVADCACEGSIVESLAVPLPFTPCLAGSPLTFAEPIDLERPAASFMRRDPLSALPSAWVEEKSDGALRWVPRLDLLSSNASDRHFVAEVNDEGNACIRFGDGEHGLRPAAGLPLTGHYRIGNGPKGNVEREAIALMVLRTSKVDVGKVSIRNLLPACGGTPAEAQAEAKLLGPGTIQARKERAIVAEDYAELAQRLPAVQGAAARLRWTGSWYEMQLAIDAFASAAQDSGLARHISSYLAPYGRIGHDLKVVTARTVPIRLTLDVCVEPGHVQGHVRAALLEAMGAGLARNGSKGFFHPDRLRFGDDIYVSRIVAAAMGVAGVQSARVTLLRRMNRADEGALESGRLAMADGEVARLDNDPNFPENGQFELIMRGGR